MLPLLDLFQNNRPILSQQTDFHKRKLEITDESNRTVGFDEW